MEADRIQVINPDDGTVFFDTQTIPGSDATGKVRFRRGSGAVISYDLGTGSNLQIIVNPGAPRTSESQFKYWITIVSPLLDKTRVIDSSY